MNRIQGTKPDGRQWNKLLDAVVTILKNNKGTIYHAIYIKLLSDGTIYYFIVSNDDVLNTTNNNKTFPELRRGFEKHFDIKFQEISVHKYMDFWVCQYPLGFSIYKAYQIMELVNEWLPTGKLIIVDTPFWIYYTYEN